MSEQPVAPRGQADGPVWHTLPGAEALRQLKSGAGGLSAREVRKRLQKFGRNELPEPEGPSALARLASQFRNPLIPILFLAAGLSGVLGKPVEAATIAAILAFCVLLGFLQESRAEQALKALRRLAAPRATAWRDGRPRVISSRELVPGDVINLQAGDRVPADARVIRAVNLRVEESALTGESEPVDKISGALDRSVMPLGDRRNMVYGGTVISYGRGQALVVATGQRTEFGRLSGLLESIERGVTPLRANLDRLARILAVLAAGVAILVVATGLHRGADWLDMLVFGVALGVAVVPEALPAVVTIALAAGVTRMAARHALVRKLPAVETLGSVNVICADKTGTLTRDEMTLRRILLAAGHDLEVTGSGYIPEGEFTEHGQPAKLTDSLRVFLQAGALASDAVLLPVKDGWDAQGDPTECALVVAAAKAGIDLTELQRAWPRVGEIPFTSERKRMTTLHQAGEGTVAYTKGAPEVLLPAATAVLTDGGERALSAGERESLLDAAKEMAEQGLRVIAVARHDGARLDDAEQALCLLGLAGIQDPPRPEVADAIAACRSAGINSVMITGDHPGTARAVAKELGLLNAGDVVTGLELDRMSAEELAARVESIDVYARVAPEHKLRIVAAWQQRGRVVAMTGDGINDAPALRKANVGIAMGLTGTEVTREAADMTLTDDNYASIAAAVEEGRKIFDNIQKFLLLLLSTNLGEIGLIAGATLLGAPLPLTAAQILLVNLATDGLPAIALAVDPVEEDVMQRAPRDPKAGVFSRGVVVMLAVAGFWTAAVTLGLYLGVRALEFSQARAMTLTFTCLVLIEFIQAYSFRSQRRSVFIRPFTNGWLNLAVGSQVILLLLLLYTPWLQGAFGTVPLGLADWGLVAATAGSILPLIELTKRVLRPWLARSA